MWFKMIEGFLYSKKSILEQSPKRFILLYRNPLRKSNKEGGKMGKISELREIILEYIFENVNLDDKKEVAVFDKLLRQLNLQST